MARLSEEHFRAIASTPTPKSTRASDRLRGIFKSRRSEDSVALQTPTTSPHTGHEPVGMSPREHESFRATANGDTGKPDSDEESPKGTVTGKADAAIAGLNSVPAAGVAAMDTPRDDVRSVSKVEVESVSSWSSPTSMQGEPMGEHNDLVPQKSYPSNIFDDNDSLSAGIREYVESKIAHAFSEHRCSCPRRAPVNVTAKFKVDNVGNESYSSSFKGFQVDADILHGDKFVGPYLIKESDLSVKAQMGVIAFYLLVVVLSAFVGPKTLLITVWRMSIFSLSYAIGCRLLAGNMNLHADLLLAPALCVLHLLYNFMCYALERYGIFKVDLGTQIMHQSLCEVGAVFNAKK